MLAQAGITQADQSESESDQEPRIRVRSSLVSSVDSNVLAAAKTAVASKRKSARFMNGTSAAERKER